MYKLKQIEMVLIPIPFSDLRSKKKRPVIVISNDSYNQKTEDIVVVAVTSNIEKKEWTILITKNDMEEGNLPTDSMIRVDKIYSLSQLIVVKRLDTIIVYPGTYSENVDVNKRLTIKSKSGAEATIVQVANPDDHVFEVMADYVNR